jgi:hypothetical protein
MRKFSLRALCQIISPAGALILILATGRLALAQSNAVDGAVKGYVTDVTGAAISNADVTLTNNGSNVASRQTSGSDGYFRYPLVPLGTYTLSVKALGYEEYRRNGITVDAGSDVAITAAMRIGAENVIVNVAADASMLESATPAIGGVVTEKEMDDLPITSRNVYNLFFFVPGAKGIPSDNFATPGYSFGGILRASWTLDGIDNADRATTSPLRLVIVTPGAVKQVQVLANGYQAEFGKSSGGQTSVITRGGDDQWRASALYLFRPQQLAAIPALGKTRTDLHWYMTEGNVGGPILRHKLFFFANYEHNPYVQPNPNTITATTVAALGLTPDQIDTQDSGQNYDSPSLRIDYNLSAKNSGFLRYVHFSNNSPFAGSGGLITNTRSTHNFDSQDGGEAQLATILTPNFLNELRFGINRRETKGGAQFEPGLTDVDVNISGYADIGNSPSTSNLIERLNQIVDNVTWQHGKHTIKGGGDYQWTQYFTKAAAARTFTFSGLTAAGPRGAVTALNQYLGTVAGTIDPATNLPYTYTSLSLALGDPSTARKMQFFNAFVQDQYRFRRNFSLTAGLRYEKQLYPEGSPDSTFAPAHLQLHSRSQSLAPRVSLTWQPMPSTMISAAGGLYFDVPNLLFFTTIVSTDGNSYHTYTVAGGASGAPTYPNVPDSVSSAFLPKPNLYVFDPNFQSMYAVHGNLRLQQALSPNFMLTMSYMFVGTRFGPYVYDANLSPTGQTLADGRPIYTTSPRPNANYGVIYQYTSHGTSNYNGLDVTLDKRLSKNLQFTANYSWSHALGDSDQNGYVASDPSNVRRDYGNMSTDVRNYFIARGLYRTSFRSKPVRWASGTGVSLMSMITSGYPLDARTTDLNGDLASNDRPLFVERNAFRGPNYVRFDARASKVFTFKEKYHLEAIIEGSNIFNHKNAACSVIGCNSAVNGAYGSGTTPASTFGNVTVAAQSRTAQVGGRFSF